MTKYINTGWKSVFENYTGKTQWMEWTTSSFLLQIATNKLNRKIMSNWFSTNKVLYKVCFWVIMHLNCGGSFHSLINITLQVKGIMYTLLNIAKYTLSLSIFLYFFSFCTVCCHLPYNNIYIILSHQNSLYEIRALVSLLSYLSL